MLQDHSLSEAILFSVSEVSESFRERIIFDALAYHEHTGYAAIGNDRDNPKRNSYGIGGRFR